MFYFLLFAIELLLLFLLSRKLINNLAGLIYKLTHSHKAVVRILAVLFLPGTILHELAHLLFAGVMLVPAGELSVIPEVREGGVKLGSVQIGRTDPFRRVIVGVAPVLLGMILIFAIFLLVKIGVSPWWQILLALYFLFQIGNTMFSSKKDIEGSILLLILTTIFTVTIALILYFLTPSIWESLWVNINKINFDFSIDFFKQASVYLIIPLTLDLLIIFLTKFVSLSSK